LKKQVWVISSLGLLLLWGCQRTAIPQKVIQGAVPITGLAEVRQNPDRFKDDTIVIGGQIIATINNEDESTTLVVLDLPLDDSQRPQKWSYSQGRFRVHTPRFLDPLVYREGREVTVAGTVTGVKTEPVGNTPYRYVELEASKIYLWPPRYPLPVSPAYPDGASHWIPNRMDSY
jgi:outer membrane lipoprotein